MHHNQAIQAKPYSLSGLRYAFHAAEDLTGTTQQQPILPYVVRVTGIKSIQGAGLWVSEPSSDPRLQLQLFLSLE